MKYLIGIDGGGTKTLLRAATFDLEPLGEMKGGASNLTALPAETVEAHLTALFDDFYAKYPHLKREDCAVVAFATAGVSTPEAYQIQHGFMEKLMPHSKYVIVSDAVPMLYAGCGGGVGIVLISGTGSVCFGRNEEGTLFRVGGWGHIIGDEGGGYAIGRDALTAIVHAFDGRGPETLLADMILPHLGLKDVFDLTDWVYRRGKGKSEIAGISWIVEKAALQGDQAALAIFDRAAEDLAKHVTAVKKKLSPEANVCVLSGSNLTKSPLLREKLAALLPDIRFVISGKDAADGCLIMAKEMI
ncbi:MAG: hypothetical protein IKM31_01150 [Oscillospiraceae bacterium]|nr:hypothetical protein [Oscillospiraceae bacterium]